MFSRANLMLRQACESDLPGLIVCDTYAQVHPARADELLLWVQQQSCYVAVSLNEPVGFVILQYTFFSNGFIPLVCVAEARQRQGVGEFLLMQAEQLCTTPKLFTSTNASNLRAQRLFARAGFVPSGIVENLDEADPELIYFKAVLQASETANPSVKGTSRKPDAPYIER